MKNYLSKEGLEKLKQELDYLENTKRKELAALLKHAISFGDLKENFAYHEAKEQQGFLEGKIRELKKMISGAVVLEKKSSEKVEIGSVVAISSKEGKDKYTIVSKIESDPFQGKISPESPLGKMMMGRKAGERFEFQGVKYTIDKVE